MKPRRPFTEDERIAASALAGVTFPVASWDKRFSRNLNLEAGITEAEAPQLWRLFLRYRRQIQCERKAELLKMAEVLAAPDFRKLQAAERAQAIIDEQREKYNAVMRQSA